MTIIDLAYRDLAMAGALVLLLAAISLRMRLGISGKIIIAALRTAIQLYLVGLVLKVIFTTTSLLWIAAIGGVMLLVAAREVAGRQHRRFTGIWSYGVSGTSMTISAVTLAVFALHVVIRPAPWYTPQYAIPLLGMLLGNTMTGVAIGLDRLTSMCWQLQDTIENRLMLGQTWQMAVSDIRRESVRSGLIPIINAMSVAGLVSLPGMMTGQILAGNPPQVAVKYQILIMFLIAAGTGFGTLSAVWLGSRRLFDHRHRLRLDRLRPPTDG